MNYCKLGDLCQIEKGKIGITKAVDGQYPLVTTAESRGSHNEYHFDKPAVIIPLVSSTGHGHASINRLHYQEGKFAVGSILAVLTPKDPELLNAQYLYTFLSTNKDQLLVSLMRGAANVSLSISKVKEVVIPVPSMDQQLEIVKKFNKLQSDISAFQAQTEKGSILLRNLRQQILQDAITGKLSEKWREANSNVESAEALLEKIKDKKEKLIIKGRIRRQKLSLPVEEKLLFKVPKGWVLCRLGEAVYLTRGSSPRPISHYVTSSPEGVNWIKIGDTQNIEKYLFKTEQRITIEGAEKSQRVEAGDLILSNSMSFGKAYILKTDGYIHDGWFLIKLLGLIDCDYFYYLILSNFIQEQFRSSATGGVVQNIRSELVYRTVIPIPPLLEQQHIAQRIEMLFNKIDRIKELKLENQNNINLLNQVVLKEMFEL